MLFRSDDRGETWEPVTSLIEHQTRERWNPGAGGMCCHSIQLDPTDPNTIYIAISAAGVFRSDDGGETWAPENKGTAADFMEDDPFPEVGQCVHKLLAPSRAKPDRLWQQNHCGVYRSDDRGDTWERLDGQRPAERLRLPARARPTDPDVAFVIPEDGAAENRGDRSDGRLGVYRTRTAAELGAAPRTACPSRPGSSVLREGMASDRRDPVGVYFGTQSGSVFVSPERGRASGSRRRGTCRRSSRSKSRSGNRSLPRLLARQAGGQKRVRGRGGDGSATRCARCRCETCSSTSAASCGRS